MSTLAFLAAAACGDGVGRPLIVTGFGGAGGASGGTASPCGAAGSLFGSSGGSGGFRSCDGLSFAGSQVPPSTYCVKAAVWPSGAEAAEQSFFEALNVLRALGTRCGTSERGDAIPSLQMNPELRCAARLHSLDMVARHFFDHVNPDGEGPAARMVEAGYPSSITQEVIAQSAEHGSTSPTVSILQELVRQGGSDCEILIDGRLSAIGVGYLGEFWTIDVAGPRP